jgi:hypothetical protein
MGTALGTATGWDVGTGTGDGGVPLKVSLISYFGSDMLTYCRYFENKSLTSSHPKSCMICSTHIWCNCRHSQCRTRLDS